MAETFETKYFSGQGPLFVAPRDANGEPTGLVFVGDISQAELSPNIETAEIVENVTGSSGIGSSFTKRTEFQFSATLRSVRHDHLALAIQGSDTARAAGSVTDEAHVAYLDKFTRLEHTNVSTVVVAGSGGTPTYVANTDYIVHAEEGLIEFISGGTITDATAVVIDYAYAAQHHVKAAPANQDLYMVFAGMNRADNNKQTRCEIYKMKLDPGVLGLIQEEHAEIPITGRVQLDSLRPAGDQFYSWKIQD
ncbi:MAG: hypothetical protein ACOY5W_09130 [Pseudomonadota bacterium]